MNPKNLKWAVIGGGNGGQSMAGHLAIMGFPVRLYDIVPETVEAIRAQGGIEVNGVVTGFGKLDLATLVLEEAVDKADIIVVVTPALAHRAIAESCADHLTDGQIVVLHPGATGGALEFRKVLTDKGCAADVTVAETNSLIYACRTSKPGRASIFGVKQRLMAAALPADRTDTVLECLQAAFPQIYGGKNVLETSLSNPNAMMHPAPTLLNTSMIESGRDWLYYWDGITPSVGAFVEALDADRLAIGRALGIDLTPIVAWYAEAYGAEGGTLSEAVKRNPAYEGIKGQTSLETRYLLEDVPMGLVPLAALGDLVQADTRRIHIVIRMIEYLLGRDLTSNGRTLDNLGLGGMTVSQLQHYLETGETDG